MNLITRKQFGGRAWEDGLEHLNNFTSICVQDFKEPDIVMLKLFPFSLKGEAKEWIYSLPLAEIKTWRELEKTFHRKYYPLFKAWQHRNELVKSMHVQKKTRNGEVLPVKKQVWVKKEKKVEEVKCLVKSRIHCLT